jgi:hypothetical protein
MENDNRAHILELLSFTEAHNRHVEALAQATGEHFNIFKILRISRREVTTHSPVLAELLNPNGNHGQGAAFLRLFLKKFDITGFDAKTTKVMPEHYIGPKTETTGGKIDILIKDGNGKMILIENKIDAVDQENQMVRYRNFAPEAPLFYLTLDCHKPSNLSEEVFNRIKCQCIAYKTEILAWLQDCRKEAACLPNVRETITQYIHLIEELTNQNTNIVMNKELIDKIVEDQKKLHAFYTLRDAEWPVQTELITRLDSKLEGLAKENGLQKQGSFQKDNGFYFTTKGLFRRNLKICFEFDKGGYNDFFFGFGNDKPDQPCLVAPELLAAFKEQFPSSNLDEPNDYFPASAYWDDPYRCWQHPAFEAICSGEFAADMNEKLAKLAKIANDVCPDEVVSQ